MANAAPTPLYRRLLGADFDTLPATLRTIHNRDGLWRYRGEVDARRGAGVLAGLCAWATRLPPTVAGPIDVEIEADASGERWTRRFIGHAMRSRLWFHEGRLLERLGAVRFEFAVKAIEGANGRSIAWRVERAAVLGCALPARWFAGVQALEFERNGRYHYDVTAALPWIGPLLRYRGWLDVDGASAGKAGNGTR